MRDRFTVGTRVIFYETENAYEVSSVNSGDNSFELDFNVNLRRCSDGVWISIRASQFLDGRYIFAGAA